MTDHSALIERLEANDPLPICPYDRRSPEYWTTNDTDPCKFCGTKNEEGAPDLCRGADTRLFAEAAAALRDLTEWRDIATAPKDGTDFIGCNGRLSFRTKMQKYYKKWPHEEGGPTFWEGWSAEDCSSHFPWKPTHWLPHPSAPNQAKEAGE